MDRRQSDPGVPDDQRWNSNIRYHDLIVRSLPRTAADVLDVGCGEGMLCRRLRRSHARVVGIDAHRPSIERAREQTCGDAGISFLHADFNEQQFDPESFDAVVSVATLHHLDAESALTSMAALLRPGGTLVVIGLARSRLPRDLGWETLATLAFLPHRLRGKQWEHPSPIVWPPPLHYDELRVLAAEVLPRSRFRRRLQWRYSLTWTKPAL